MTDEQKQGTSELLTALRSGKQADADGVTVIVSRQACEEAADLIDAFPETWRCFHCGDVFTTHETAMEHFGPSQFEEPACKIDIAKYREMEELHRRHCEEDSDSDREFHRMRSSHSTALVREEEKGYARGLEDARKYPDTLGLMPLTELNRRTPPAAGQSGWALYPKEPTQAMRDAYDRAPGPGTGWWAWKVMTEAAPPPPAAAEGKGECRPLKEWHEDRGSVVWWMFPHNEPAWIGRPDDDDWPGYHTHWTPHPSMPDLPASAGEA